MKLLLISIGLLATLALARLGGKADPSLPSPAPRVTPLAPIVDLTGLGFFSRKNMTYHLVHGEWDQQTFDRDSIKYTPRGTGQHCVEMGWTVAFSEAPLLVNVPAEGEFFVLPTAIVIDFSGTGSIEWERVSRGELNPFCDSDKTNVISCVMTGTCWEKPFITNPETGEYTRKCNKHSGTDCVATTTQNTTPPIVATTNWGCVNGGGDDRTIHFVPADNRFEARNAVTCGAARPPSDPRQ